MIGSNSIDRTDLREDELLSLQIIILFIFICTQ